MMEDIVKVINGLEKLCNGKSSNVPFVCYDALELLKAQQAEIERLKALADSGNRKKHLSDYEKACLNNARVTYAVNQDAPFKEGVIQMTVLKELLNLIDITCNADE